MMKTFAWFLLCLTACAAIPAGAQAVEAARGRQLTLTAGGMISGFNPDYADPAYDGTNFLFGGGTYIDFHLSHWVQIEAEGRWLRIPTSIGSDESQSNYLIGPRVPIKRFGKFQTYGKVLIGEAKMTFPQGDNFTTGRFTDLTFGGTLDYRLNRRWSIRAVDFEYQDWPKFIPKDPTVPNSPSISLQPYGLSVGVGYRVF
ncbi:outer membrane beta-barrel protein [Terracidiphilus gabretensis]|uniref:outer membrane beta-barrel protein n=1 Tax=Terracidiphilus gabretensis TaxID=1577687 RepID=UPI00071C19BB|nr:outer membrane beta-barrel protein [Terracidiphilus gabretensis]